MTEFVASNGIRVVAEGAGCLMDVQLTDTVGRNRLKGWGFLNAGDMDALTEFITARRDEELGRWHWPKHPEYVVYPKEPTVTDPDANFRVVHEVTGRSRDVDIDVLLQYGANSRFGEAALAYADAHPAPKPWQDAKDGEVWRITSKAASAPRLATVHNGYFWFAGGGYDATDSKLIKAGERVFTEESE